MLQGLFMMNFLVKSLYRLSLAFLFLVVTQIPVSADQKNTDFSFATLDKFWPAFRSMALNGDKAKLAKLTQFPVLLHGTLDDDPVIKMDRKSFENNIDIILSQDPGDPSATQAETTLDLFKRTKVLNDEDGSAHIGDLEFSLIEGRWLWVKAYIDQDELK